MKQLIAVILCLTLLLAGCGTAPSSQTTTDQVPESLPTEGTPQPLVQAKAVYPLTGQEMTGEVQRPVAVMVNNAAQAGARQWGLGSASVILEALTEGESTNWMLWFDNLESVPKVGPIAPGKDLFWQFALPMSSILVQKGMNTYAENLLNCYGWQPLDALMLGVNSFDYDGSDPAMPMEYSWYTQGSSLQYGIDQYQMPLTGEVPVWQYFGSPVQGDAAAAITVNFSEKQSTTLRFENGGWMLYRADGTQQLDANNGVPVQVTNVLVLCSEPSVKDDKFTREYDLTEEEGLYLVNGTWQKVTWKKGDVADGLQLFSETGTPLVMAPGKTYMAVYGGFQGQSLTITDAEDNVVYPVAEAESESESDTEAAA